MIYSEWKPDTGGFIYYEAPGVQNINDDLPSPDLKPATKIGVPSIEAGRALPAGSRRVGEGDVAVGVMAPVDPKRIVRRTRALAGLDDPARSQSLWVAVGAAAVLGLWFWKNK